MLVFIKQLKLVSYTKVMTFFFSSKTTVIGLRLLY
jgi:hypothetical protein